MTDTKLKALLNTKNLYLGAVGLAEERAEAEELELDIEDCNRTPVDLSLNDSDFIKTYGRKKIASTHTLGCKVNKYETEAMEELLQAEGYEIGDFTEPADVYIINTCTVTAMSEKKSRQMIRRTKKMNPHAVVVVMGCYSQKSPEEIFQIEEVNLVLGTSQRYVLVEELRKTSSEDKKIVVDDIMKIRDFEEMQITNVSDRTRALVKIQDGCDRFCSYCIIPYTRGPVRSRELGNIIKEVQRLAENGYKEVVLTGIHVASYGKDIKEQEIKLADVIDQIAEIPGIERIRTSSVEPLIITKEFMERVSKIPAFCDHFHLSMQSGSDAVLKRMNRRYSAGEYARAVKLIREYYPDAAVTTDVIVGFPQESAEEFEETRRFLAEIQLYETHVFKYSPREGTKAMALGDDIGGQEKTARSNILIDLSHENKDKHHQKILGRTLEVLFENSDEEYYYGHTKNYIKVAVPKSERNLINQILSVEAKQIMEDFILGEI